MAPTYVVGDWCYDDEALRYTIAFEATRMGQPWSGGVVPLVTRPVADRVVRLQGELIGDTAWVDPAADIDQFMWEGDTLVRYTAAAGAAERITPDADGLYDIGFGWCWDPLSGTTDSAATYVHADGSTSGPRRVICRELDPARITTRAVAEQAVVQLALALGTGWHPDDDLTQFVDLSTDQPFLCPDDAWRLNHVVGQIFALGVDASELALDANTPGWRDKYDEPDRERLLEDLLGRYGLATDPAEQTRLREEIKALARRM